VLAHAFADEGVRASQCHVAPFNSGLSFGPGDIMSWTPSRFHQADGVALEHPQASATFYIPHSREGTGRCLIFIVSFFSSPGVYAWVRNKGRY
jgi:hypothetical protein